MPPLRRCPECGKLPPGRKKSESFRELLGRKLSYRRSGSAKSNQSRGREARTRSKTREERDGWNMQVKDFAFYFSVSVLV